MKTYFAAAAALPGASADSHIITSCHNLRPARGGRALEVAPRPRPVAPVAGRVIDLRTADDGDLLLVKDGKRLHICRAGGVPVTVDTADADFNACFSGDCIVLWEAGHMRRIALDGSPVESPQPAHPLVIRAEAATPVSAYLGSISLSRLYSPGQRLRAADASRLASAAADVYRRLDAESHSRGVLIAPAIFMARLTDRFGEVIMQTEPALLSCPGCACWDGIVEFAPAADEGDKTSATAATTITVDAWNVVVDIPDEFRGTSCRLEIFSSPRLHRVNPDGGYDVTMRRRADDSFLARAVPRGDGSGLWTGSPESRAGVLRALLSRNDALMEYPMLHLLRNTSRTKKIVPRGINAASDISDVRSILSTPVVLDPLAPFAPPHGYSAAVIAHGPAVTAMAGLRTTYHGGLGIEALASSVDAADGAWHAAVKVSLDDGSSLVATADGTSGAPLTLGPVLSYPSARAVSMYVILRRGASVRSGTFPLQPTDDGRRAVYIDPQLSHITLTDVETDYVVPAARSTPVAHDGVIALMPRGSSAPSAAVTLPPGRIHAIVPARHSQGAWEYGRARFWVFTDSGIYSLATDSTCRSTGISRVDSRPVDGPHAVCDGGDTLWVLAGGNLLAITGSRITSQGHFPDAVALGCDRRRGELWLIPRSGHTSVLIPATGLYTLGIKAVAADTATVAGRSFISDGMTLYEAGTEAEAADTDIAWLLRAAGDDPRRPASRRLDLAVAGTARSLTASLSRLYINRAAPGARLSLSLSGEIRSALRRPFMARGGDFELSLHGKVAPDFIINSLTII